MDQDAVGVIGLNGLSELLQRPLSRRMSSDIDVEESAAFMFNHHKDIKQAERRGDGYAEVTRHDTFSMVVHKRGPALSLTPLAWATDAVVRHVFAHGPRRHLEAKLEQQLVGDAFLPPGRILQSHAANQRPQVLGQSGSP